MPGAKVRITTRQRNPFVMIPKVFFTRYDPTWRAILAYMALSYYAGNESAACEGISIKTLAGRVATSEDTLKRGLAELARKGIVEKKQRSKKAASGERQPLPNLYELMDMQPTAKDPI